MVKQGKPRGGFGLGNIGSWLNPPSYSRNGWAFAKLEFLQISWEICVWEEGE